MGEFLRTESYHTGKNNIQEYNMITSILPLLLLPMLIFLALSPDTHLTPEELADMGVRL